MKELYNEIANAISNLNFTGIETALIAEACGVVERTATEFISDAGATLTVAELKELSTVVDTSDMTMVEFLQVASLYRAKKILALEAMLPIHTPVMTLQ